MEVSEITFDSCLFKILAKFWSKFTRNCPTFYRIHMRQNFLHRPFSVYYFFWLTFSHSIRFVLHSMRQRLSLLLCLNVLTVVGELCNTIIEYERTLSTATHPAYKHKLFTELTSMQIRFGFGRVCVLTRQWFSNFIFPPLSFALTHKRTGLSRWRRLTSKQTMRSNKNCFVLRAPFR